MYDIGMHMTNTLEYLRRHYGAYFNMQGPVSPWLAVKNRRLVNYRQLITRFEQKMIDPELVQILEEYIGYLNIPENPVIENLRQYYYLKDIAAELELFSLLPATENDTFSLIRRLIGYDFNVLPFYDFMTGYIKRTAPEELPYEIRELELLNLLKEMETIRIERPVGFLSEVQPLKESICRSIDHDLANIAKMKALLNTPNSAIPGFYFTVSFTIEQLLFMFRIAMEETLVKCRFKSHLYAFISRHIRFSRSDTPSHQYMRNLFSSEEVPQKVVRAVRAALMTMVNRIDNVYLRHGA